MAGGLDAPAPAVGGAARGVARIAEPVADEGLEPRYLRHRRLGAEPLDREASKLGCGPEPVLHALGAERDGHQDVGLEHDHLREAGRRIEGERAVADALDRLHVALGGLRIEEPGAARVLVDADLELRLVAAGTLILAVADAVVLAGPDLVLQRIRHLVHGRERARVGLGLRTAAGERRHCGKGEQKCGRQGRQKEAHGSKTPHGLLVAIDSSVPPWRKPWAHHGDMVPTASANETGGQSAARRHVGENLRLRPGAARSPGPRAIPAAPRICAARHA